MASITLLENNISIFFYWIGFSDVHQKKSSVRENILHSKIIRHFYPDRN